jgi:hypothetical protein
MNSQNNSGMCSSRFGAVGITRAKQTNVVPQGIIKLACMSHPSGCIADIYLTDNCGGPIIATAKFDIASGIQSIAMSPSSSKEYKIIYHGFFIQIDPLVPVTNNSPLSLFKKLFS